MQQEKKRDNSPVYDERPWGSFTVLDEGEGYHYPKIKFIDTDNLNKILRLWLGIFWK